MSDSDRDQRVSGALTLHEAIESLLKVEEARRREFVHDRLMSSIDDICAAAKGSNGKVPFNDAQITILKDISYRIVYILDPSNKKKRGFFRRLLGEFKDQKLFEKLRTIIMVVGALGAAATALYTWYNWGSSWFNDHWKSAPATSAASASKEAPAAPSPQATPTKQPATSGPAK